MAVWQCRLLLSIVLLHLVLTSPVVRRDIQLLDNATPLSGEPAEVVGEDAFGPVLESRGGREKRLLKTLGLGALGVKAAKAVGTKVVAGSVKALGAKAGAVVKAAAGGALAVKAKALGVKTVTAVAALGLKALIVKLLFGKVNQFITQKEKLLRQLDRYNRQQNEKFSQQMFGVAPCKNAGPAPTVAAPPAELPPNFPGGEFPPDGLPQDQGYVLRRRR